MTPASWQQCSGLHQSRWCRYWFFCGVHPISDSQCFSVGQTNPKNCPFSLRIWTPYNMWFIGHLDQLSHFEWLTNATNRQTHVPCYSICSTRPDLASAVMWPNNDHMLDYGILNDAWLYCFVEPLLFPHWFLCLCCSCWSNMVKSRQETRRPMYLPSPTSEVYYRGKDEGCCGIFYLKHVLYVFNFILVVNFMSNNNDDGGGRCQLSWFYTDHPGVPCPVFIWNCPTIYCKSTGVLVWYVGSMPSTISEIRYWSKIANFYPCHPYLVASIVEDTHTNLPRSIVHELSLILFSWSLNIS